jgi:hypothetical protein
VVQFTRHAGDVSVGLHTVVMGHPAKTATPAIAAASTPTGTAVPERFANISIPP